MAEKPIIMSAESIRAIWAGRKTQTRRTVKPQPDNPIDDPGFDPVNLVWRWDSENERRSRYMEGDALWVRETWAQVPWVNGDGSETMSYLYAVDGPDFPIWDTERGDRWKSSMFMPKAAARLWLTVTGVRCERVQDISAYDATSEGIDLAWGDRQTLGSDEDRARIQLFGQIWDAINAKRGFPFAANPYVWVYEFKEGA